ncbi:MAG: hypothetical protein ACREPM_25720, partial [Gemmatimonadaceae bacterium]
YQGGRRMSDLQSLLNAGPLGLQTIGISTDSVNHLLSTLRGWKLPMTLGAPNNRYQDQALVFSSVDFIPPTSVTGQAFNLTFTGSWNRQDPASFSNTELPSHSGERSNWNMGLFGKHSSYFGFGVLSETSLGFNTAHISSSPFLDLPNANVRVNSTFADGTPSVQTISFGGNPAMNIGVTQSSEQFTNALSWFSENNKHRIKYTTELRRDEYSQDLTTNQLGTFSFNSLSDLDAGRPALFSRQLTPLKRSDAVYIGGLSLGDSYRPSDDLQVQYGVRVDGNRFDAEPLYNADIDRLFSSRNDRVPDKAYVSPRIGFSWTYGTNQQIAGFDGGVRGPRAVLRGGVGVFQNTPSAASIGTAMDNNGLSTGAQQLVCVGNAAPTPDWASYMSNLGAVPTTCANGAASTVFASTAPNVAMFDKNYEAPRAIRSNLNWSGSMLDNRFRLNADLTYSLNENQPGSYDLNFNPAAQFSLANEADRPIYAQAANIVTTTGTIGANEGRVTPLYSHVTQLRSDLRSETKQFTVNVQPMSFNTTFTWGLAYVYQNSREEYRGFSSTAGDPRDLAWSRSGFDSRHQFQYRLTYNAFDFVRIGWNGSFRSGNPYTPVVATDINGDGYANDRAFVYNPAATSDTALANGMRALLTSGSGSARDCLQRQLGQIAGRTSCEGPWYSTANMTFSFNPLKVRLPQRASLSFQISNPLGAADLLLHGDNKLHGWGQGAFPQNQLLYVRGFDPSTHEYAYEVNQRFGATGINQTASRIPVTLTAMMRVDVGPTLERQLLTQMLDRGRTLNGQKMPEIALKAYGSNGVINPMAQILRQADTLELTSVQADSIAVLNRLYTIRLDSTWSPVAKYLSALPERYDQGEAYEKYRLARQMSVDALIKVVPNVKSLLTDAQMRKLPTFITPFLDARYLSSIRSGTSGTGLGMIMMPGGGMAIPGGIGGGGGGMQVIIKTGSP